MTRECRDLPLYCAMVQPGAGGPLIQRYWYSKERALRSAKGLLKRYGGVEASVAWCRPGSADPKVWVAYVRADGVTLTSHWDDEV